MNAKDFLRAKGLVQSDCNEFVITFEDGKEIELSSLMIEWLLQLQASDIAQMSAPVLKPGIQQKESREIL